MEPTLWITRAHCTSCATKRLRYFRVGDALPVSDWSYEHPQDWKHAMFGVSQMEARAELARRDIAGEGEGGKIAALRRARKSKRSATG